MREIKFRAWDKERKFIFYPTKFEVSTIGTIKKVFHFEIDNNYESEILMQYTGLKDKNGKEIYEGDIVEILNYKQVWKHKEPEGNWKRFFVEWNQNTYAFNNEWIYTPLSRYDINDLMEFDIKIIGNIYENPELLKVV